MLNDSGARLLYFLHDTTPIQLRLKHCRCCLSGQHLHWSNTAPLEPQPVQDRSAWLSHDPSVYDNAPIRDYVSDNVPTHF